MGNPLLKEWVLSPSSPVERHRSHPPGPQARRDAPLPVPALQPRRLACRRLGSSGRPPLRHPFQLQRVETPLQPPRTRLQTIPDSPGSHSATPTLLRLCVIRKVL